MPPRVISGPDSEAMWDRAKKHIVKQYPELKGAEKGKDKAKKSRFFSLVMHLYKSFCTSKKHKCKPTLKTHPSAKTKAKAAAEESPMRSLIDRLEEMADTSSPRSRGREMVNDDVGRLAAMRSAYEKLAEKLVDKFKKDGDEKGFAGLVSELRQAREGKASRLYYDAERALKRIASDRARKKAPTFNLTARQLELFSEMKGVDKAAKEISAALTKAAKELFGTMKNMPEFAERTLGTKLASVYEKQVRPVMAKNGKFGATDSEPLYHAKQVLIDFIKDYYEIEYFTSLGDYV